MLKLDAETTILDTCKIFRDTYSDAIQGERKCYMELSINYDTFFMIVRIETIFLKLFTENLVLTTL